MPADVFPQEERQERDHDEEHRVVHRAIVALVDVHGLVERHADAALGKRDSCGAPARTSASNQLWPKLRLISSTDQRA